MALVGRPNVGKSTLFNRFIGRRRAIVEETPGTTRDRHYADVEWTGHTFTLIDTGGIVTNPDDPLTEQVLDQAQLAIQEADVIVLVTDIMDGVTAPDEEVADILRRTSKPIVLAVNKADNVQREVRAAEFYALGIGEPHCVSAERGLSTGDLLDAIVDALPSESELAEADEEGLRVAIVGRTNVGKSSLLNRILGEERVIASPTPHTTRDAIDTPIYYEDRDIVLIDTAGIRRRGRIKPGVEKYSVLRAIRAINRAQVALLVIDAIDGVTAQDAHIAGYVLDQNKSVIIVVNKWDLIEKDSDTMGYYERMVRRELRFLSYAPIMFVSALTGQRVSEILPMAIRIEEERQTRLKTSDVNRIILEATARRSPPSKSGKQLRIYYGSQVSVAPPTFIFFVNDTELVHFGYRRYLENQIRQRYPFVGTPLKLIFRGR